MSRATRSSLRDRPTKWEPILKRKFEAAIENDSDNIKFVIDNELFIICKLLRKEKEYECYLWPSEWPDTVVEVIVFKVEGNNNSLRHKFLEHLSESVSDVNMEESTTEWNSKYYDYHGTALYHLLTQFTNCQPDMVFY